MTTTMTIRLDDETNKRLTNLAGATDRSKAYLTMQTASPGQFVDNETVMAWMETWGTDHESKPPL